MVHEAARRVMQQLGDGGTLGDADAGLAMRDTGYALKLANAPRRRFSRRPARTDCISVTLSSAATATFSPPATTVR